MNLEIAKSESGLFFPYFKILTIMDQKFQQEFVRTIDNSVEGFYTHYQILLSFLFWQNKNGVFVELGSYCGKSTVVTLLALEGNDYEFHAVDTFMGSEEHKEMLQGQSTYDKYCANLNKFGLLDKVNTHIGTSYDISKEFDDDSIDGIFIDAAHDYDNVVLDIESWYPKVRSGGFMIGHDYPHPNDPNGGFEGLRDAVNEHVRDDKRFTKFGHLFAIWGAIKK
jgi:predicted O-methyltransferase YrrM